jgi:hypothetical protein
MPNSIILRCFLAPGALACAAALAGAQGSNVTIEWDTRGIPHVDAPTDEQVWFGQGYATAVDRLAQMHRIREATYGRLAALIGELPPGYVVEGLTPFEQDKEVLHVGIREAAQDRWEALDEPTKSALTSFAAGVNAYLDELHALAQLGSIDAYLAEPLEGVASSIEQGTYPDWEPQDAIASWIWWFYWFKGGSGSYAGELGCLAPVGELQPVAEESTVIVQDDVYPNIQQRIGQYWALYDQGHVTDCTDPEMSPCENEAVAPPRDLSEGRTVSRPERRFSEAWVLSGAMNGGSDAAALQSSTKIRVMTPSMYHEIHLTQSDPVAGWDVRGVQFVGAPGLFNAFSSRVAWGTTGVDPDTDDLIRLEMNAETPNPLDYWLDGVLYEIELTPVDIYDGIPGNPPVSITIARSMLGPIVNDVIDRTNPALAASGIYVLRATDFWGKEERNTMQALIRLPKARDVRQFRQASKYWRSPSVHCVFGDVDGDIGYQPFMAVPTRGDPVCDAGDRVVCLGGSSSNDWVRTVPFDLLPWAIRNDGYLSIANHRPTGCWYPIPLWLNVSKGPSTRSVRLWEILEGCDPDYPSFSIGTGTVEELARMSFDTIAIHERAVVEMGKRFRDGMGVTCTEGFELSQDALDALAELEPWLGLGTPSVLVEPSNLSENHFLKLASLLYRIPNAAETSLLYDKYGSGAGGFTALFHDLLRRDCNGELLDCMEEFDIQICNYVNYMLEQANLAAYAYPQGITYPTDFAYFDFTGRIGGSTPSMNGEKDVSVDLIAIDSTTLWDAPSRAFSQTVDLGFPELARGLHPLGNHEDPDHPVLEDYYDDAADTPVWIDGTVGVGPQPYFDALQPMPLAEPDPEDVVHTEDPAYAPRVSYYGLDYGGNDPQRGLSIGLVNPGQSLAPCDDVVVRVAGIPRIADLDLASPELEYKVELRADMQKVWQPDTTSPVVYLVDRNLAPVATATTTADSVDLTVKIPMNAQPGDQFCLQAVLKRTQQLVLLPVGHPLLLSGRVSTMGMVLVVE